MRSRLSLTNEQLALYDLRGGGSAAGGSPAAWPGLRRVSSIPPDRGVIMCNTGSRFARIAEIFDRYFLM